MKKIFFIALILLSFKTQAQVWYPEGVYLGKNPEKIEVDSQVFILTKIGVKDNHSLWQLSVLEGKIWVNFPVLELNLSAKIKCIKRFNSEIYLAGEFTFDSENYNALVKLKNNNTWTGITKFQKENNDFARINDLEINGTRLVVAGNFFKINDDEHPFLAIYNGLSFDNFKVSTETYSPNNEIIDLEFKDGIYVFSGLFTKFNRFNSKYLFKINNGIIDTFMNFSKPIENLLIHNNEIYGIQAQIKPNFKNIIKIDLNKTVFEINKNLDSIYEVSNLLILDNELVINGLFFMNNSKSLSTLILENNNWKNISNNFKNQKYISVYRNQLFAIGFTPDGMSIWNPNKQIARFYKNMSLLRIKAFLDSDNNCIQDENENGLAKQFIKISNTSRAAFTNDKGFIEFLVPNLNNTLRFVIKPSKNLVRSNCADTSVTKTLTSNRFLDTIQFPLKRLNNIKDIRIFINSPKGGNVVKNKRVLYEILFENLGSETISGVIRLKSHPLFSNPIAIPNYKSKINDSLFEWEYSNLAPGESRKIIFSAMPNHIKFEENNSFFASASAQISSNQSALTEDDFDSIPQSTGSNFSAFKKDVYPQPNFNDSVTYLSSSDRDLRYHISFNNFGNDTVFYAIVIDTLDLNLDMSYIQETGSNVNYYTEVQTDPNNQYKGILIWHFPQIKLIPNPTKNYEIQSSGAYIGFKVITKPLSNGYMLKNVASVFYDNQFAGNTNAVYCTIASLNTTELINNNDFLLYPNPNSGQFKIDFDFKTNDIIQIYSSNGQLINTLNHLTDPKELNLDLENGIYFLVINSGYQVIKKKFIIQN